jgi:hypothetical protein
MLDDQPSGPDFVVSLRLLVPQRFERPAKLAVKISFTQELQKGRPCSKPGRTWGGAQDYDIRQRS